MGFTNERRYGTSRWRRLAQSVTREARYVCWAPGCSRRANVADHIRRVTPETTDAEFFDRSGLRASCVQHNLARGIAGDDDVRPRSSAWQPIVRDFRR